jgi:L-histidine N-alpha-methyltransferase
MYDVSADDGATRPAAFHDHHPGEDSFRAALIEGLSRPQKAIPCRFLYDARGSALFDRICELPEYYPTRTEIKILRDNAADIAAAIGPCAQLVELGSGSSVKVRILLDALRAPVSYVPIDISREHLLAAAGAIQADYPDLTVEAVCADFGQTFDLPVRRGDGRRVGFYPGSTIGNLEPHEARVFLARWAERLGAGALMLIGVDLRKDPGILEPAYDDPQGVTAAFSKNLLERANRELGADFDIGAFEHVARYDPKSGQVRIDLISQTRQSVRVAGRSFAFAKGEPLHVENSYKYGLEGFRDLARSAGYRPRACWTDARALFSVHLLEVI